jgi:hypothetical protein
MSGTLTKGHGNIQYRPIPCGDDLAVGSLAERYSTGTTGGYAVALPAQSADLEFQPDDLVCAFYNGDGSQLNDLAVDFISQGLCAGNNKI